jgi:hypothetical protein
MSCGIGMSKDTLTFLEQDFLTILKSDVALLEICEANGCRFSGAERLLDMHKALANALKEYIDRPMSAQGLYTEYENRLIERRRSIENGGS